MGGKQGGPILCISTSSRFSFEWRWDDDNAKGAFPLTWHGRQNHVLHFFYLRSILVHTQAHTHDKREIEKSEKIVKECHTVLLSDLVSLQRKLSLSLAEHGCVQICEKRWEEHVDPLIYMKIWHGKCHVHMYICTWHDDIKHPWTFCLLSAQIIIITKGKKESCWGNRKKVRHCGKKYFALCSSLIFIYGFIQMCNSQWCK